VQRRRDWERDRVESRTSVLCLQGSEALINYDQYRALVFARRDCKDTVYEHELWNKKPAELREWLVGREEEMLREVGRYAATPVWEPFPQARHARISAGGRDVA
jgi:hypothetical protein